MPICDICMSDLDPDSYSELLLKSRAGALAPIVTRSVGLLCVECVQRLEGGMAGAIPRPEPTRR